MKTTPKKLFAFFLGTIAFCIPLYASAHIEGVKKAGGVDVGITDSGELFAGQSYPFKVVFSEENVPLADFTATLTISRDGKPILRQNITTNARGEAPITFKPQNTGTYTFHVDLLDPKSGAADSADFPYEVRSGSHIVGSIFNFLLYATGPLLIGVGALAYFKLKKKPPQIGGYIQS